MFFKYLDRFFDRQSLDRVSVAGHCRCLKHRVVHRFLRRFDRGQKQRRHRVVGHYFHVPRQRFVIGMDPHLRRCRECDRVVQTILWEDARGHSQAFDLKRRERPSRVPPRPNRRFEFHKSGQLFIRTNDEALTVAAMGVSNEHCSPARMYV